jgi:hypothetical protein
MCYIQLAAPLCLVCHCWTFVVMDDKGGEILIKASDVFHVLSLYLETCTAAIVCYELHCCILRLRYRVCEIDCIMYHVRVETYASWMYHLRLM